MKIISQPWQKQTPSRDKNENDVTASTNSTNSPEGASPEITQTPLNNFSKAFYPEDSLVARWVQFAQTQIESATCYQLGAFLPVVARCLARQAWFPWGTERIYSNIFSILAGKPGDRKSSAISLAQRIVSTSLEKGETLLQQSALLTCSLSSAALLDEYDPQTGGCEDKLLIEDEGNVFLSNISARPGVGHQLLSLYDCKGIAENFKRNKRDKQDASGRRIIEETSTSIIIGATLNIASFKGMSIQAGLQRRFLYYLAEGHGSFIARPNGTGKEELIAIAKCLKNIMTNCKGPFKFDKTAEQFWIEIQRQNRLKLRLAETEAAAGRLNGEPVNILKISMLFAACMEENMRNREITAEILDCAARHVDACNLAAAQLESVAHREQINESAEILVSRICRDFHHLKDKAGWIELSRSQITAKYASHPNRNGALTTTAIYSRLIPTLEKSGYARFVSKNGKAETWAFSLRGT